eukprot:RCo035381
MGGGGTPQGRTEEEWVHSMEETPPGFCFHHHLHFSEPPSLSHFFAVVASKRRQQHTQVWKCDLFCGITAADSFAISAPVPPLCRPFGNIFGGATGGPPCQVSTPEEGVVSVGRHRNTKKKK